MNPLRLAIALALAATLAACDNPFKTDPGSATPGESTQAEDDDAISNYVVNVYISGDRNNTVIGPGTVDTRDNHSTTETAPAQEATPAP